MDPPNYPSLRYRMQETLGRAVTWSAVRHWRSGYRPLPVWAARVLADQIEARCRHGLMLVDALRSHAHDMGERPMRHAVAPVWRRRGPCGGVRVPRNRD